MKLPSKAQWDEIGKAFDTPLEERDRRRKFLTMTNNIISRGGICFAVQRVTNYYWGWFMHAFDPCLNDELFWWPNTDAGDRERAFFCMLMAAITEAGDMESLVEEA